MAAHSNNLNPDRLLQLSDEVGRIATTLARLSTDSGQGSGIPEVSAATVRSVIHARRLRSCFFPAELFADPAWDILLELLLAEISQQRVSVSNACVAAAVPATTALRWVNVLVQQGLVIREADPLDGRRVFVELAPDASVALRSYFAELGTTKAP
jgi:hypothetical protein